VFSNLNFWEVGGLLLLALFIFGPERLPKVISDGVRLIRNMRDMARNATSDLSRELGTEVRLEDLHPKTFIRKHLLSEDEEAQIRRPFDDAFADVRQIASDTNDSIAPPQRPDPPRADTARSDMARSDPVRTDSGLTDPPRFDQADGDSPGPETPRPDALWSESMPRTDDTTYGSPYGKHRYDSDAT
jgi:sec-independent protein translocase protein TatB